MDKYKKELIETIKQFGHNILSEFKLMEQHKDVPIADRLIMICLDYESYYGFLKRFQLRKRFDKKWT